MVVPFTCHTYCLLYDQACLSFHAVASLDVLGNAGAKTGALMVAVGAAAAGHPPPLGPPLPAHPAADAPPLLCL